MPVQSPFQAIAFAKGKPLHIVFWVVIGLIPFLMLLIDRHWSTLPRAVFVYLFVLTGIYAGRWLCRRWLLNGRWLASVVACIIVLIVLGIGGTAGYVGFFNPDMPLNHVLETAINMTAGSFFLLTTGFVIAVTRSAIKEKFQALQLAEQKKATELGLLRAQVSPHFLFNTLHNLYSLSLNRPAQMPALLLRLAELLRYSVYEAEQPLVSLKEEIDYLQNYIALETIRLADRLVLTITFGDCDAEARIAPMLLIGFVENAFKHGRETVAEKVEIDIALKLNQGQLTFTVKNTCAVEEKPTHEKRSGFGIANVVKRLDLLYPGAYQLQQERKAGWYKTRLQLSIDHGKDQVPYH